MSTPLSRLHNKFHTSNRYANFGAVIRSMQVCGFRGIADLTVDVEFPITAISGLNGAGKSTIGHPYRPHISIARFDTTNVVHDPTSAFDRMSLHLGEFCRGLPNRHFRATEIVLYDSVSGHYRERFNLQLKVEEGNF